MNTSALLVWGGVLSTGESTIPPIIEELWIGKCQDLRFSSFKMIMKNITHTHPHIYSCVCVCI